MNHFRWALVISFFVFVLSELFLGPVDVGTIVAPILFVLLLFTFSRPQENTSSVASEDSKNKGIVKRMLASVSYFFIAIKREIFAEGEIKKGQKAVKILMNNLFILMFMMAIIGSAFHIQSTEVKLVGVLIWSMAFIALNIREFIQTLSYGRLMMINFGIFIFLLTCIQIVA